MGRCLGLDGHLAVSLRNIARTVAVIQHGGQCAGRSERHASLMVAIGGKADLTRTSQIWRRLTRFCRQLVSGEP